MKVIITGIGKLGEYLVYQLVDEDLDITIIDRDFSNKKDIISNYDVNYVEGNALDPDVLIEAGIKDTDLIISVLEKDEQNIMCSLIAKKLGAKHTIARIRTPEYSNLIDLLKDELNLSMIINPDLMTASSIARTLNIPSAIDSTTFLKDKIEMITIKVKKSSPLSKISVHYLLKNNDFNVIICAIERNGKTIIPRGSTKLLENDKIYIIATHENISKVLKFLKLKSEKIKNVMIAGGSSLAVYLTKIISKIGMNVKIIEINKERCKELCCILPNATIVNGDVSDQDVLYEEGIEEADAFISLTSIDEENIVCSMFAHGLNVPKVITKVNHIKLNGVIEKSQIDIAIAPHKIAANQIVKYVRAMVFSGGSSCEAVYDHDDIFEMLEFRILKDFKKVNTKLSDLKLKEGILIGAIQRKKDIIFPTGKDMIKEDDIVIVVNASHKIKDINDILE